MIGLSEAALLGVVHAVRGLAEFLPAPSSVRLLLAQHFLGVDRKSFGLPFDAAVQSGTLVSAVRSFWRGFLGMGGPGAPRDAASRLRPRPSIRHNGAPGYYRLGPR